jgi:hypothetical protein
MKIGQLRANPKNSSSFFFQNYQEIFNALFALPNAPALAVYLAHLVIDLMG